MHISTKDAGDSDTGESIRKNARNEWVKHTGRCYQDQHKEE